MVLENITLVLAGTLTALVTGLYFGYSVSVNGGPPCSVNNPFYHYVLHTINGGNPPPAVQPLSVREVARSKFGDDNFSVKSRFPRHRTGSLRLSLIGLRG